MSSGPCAHRPRRSRGGRRRRAGAALRTRTPASQDRRAARARSARALVSSSLLSPSAPHASKQKPSPAHGTRARGATRSWPAIAGGPLASAVTERPSVTVGFRASLGNALQDAVSRDPFAPLPPPGLTPRPGSLSVIRGLIAPARATFDKTVAPGVGVPTGKGPGRRGPRQGRAPSSRLWAQALAARLKA